MTDTNRIINKALLHPPFMPDIDGLVFRKFRGELDYPLMLDIINIVKMTDKTERSDTIENITNGYAHLVRCNPEKDLIFAEINGETVGYGRCWWNTDAATGEYLYEHFVFLKPAWREKQIGRAMTQYLQQRGREVAKEHPTDAPKFFQVSAMETEVWNTQLYENDGFEAIRYGFSMERSLMTPLPEVKKPEGIEVRAYQPEHLHPIYVAETEAFRDHWGFVEPVPEQADFKNWQDDPTFKPHLWKIAWVGDEVAGMMLNMHNEKENEEYGLKRGYSENISTVRQFRKRGIASYLIVETMKMFKEMGMDHVALSVDALNPNGALKLYEGLGYTVTKKSQLFRKKMG